MRSTKIYIKYTGSRLPDAFFDVAIDDEKNLVSVLAKPFDSAMLAQLVTVVLVDHFGVIAFDDDNVVGFGRGRALHNLELVFDGLKFEAVVTKRLSVLRVGATVGLRPSKPC